MKLEEYLRELSQIHILEPDQEQRLWADFKEHGDETARRVLIESYQLLVFRTAMSYREAENIMDILQEGTVGLIEAVESFDHSRGVAFSLYAVHRIRGRMIDFLQKEGRADLPCMDVKQEEIGMTWKECLADMAPPVHEQAELLELSQRLHQALDRLPQKERMVLEDVYFNSGEAKDVAEEMQVSVAHIYRLQKQGIRRIRGMLSRFMNHWISG